MKPYLVPVAALFCLLSAAEADEGRQLPKALLKSNGQLCYCEKPGRAETLGELFSQGKFYGRLRSNSFLYRWEKEDSLHDDHFITAVGASLVFDSARYEGFGFRLGLYGSRAFFDAQRDPVARLKGGKDLLSRYDYVNTGSRSMGVAAQAYVSYSGIDDTRLIVGRQLVETFYTRSNDTKMIPNSFDGVTVHTTAWSGMKATVAYLAKQKLRDHTEAHPVLMYGDAGCDTHLFPQWSGNDDSVMHRGLTCSALKAAGKPTDAPLIVGDIESEPTEALKLNAAFYLVPELISQAMGELNYTFRFDGFSLIPGLRYIWQFDNGAGEVGGASYTADTSGYKNPNSLESRMIAARLVAKTSLYRFNFGYSQVFDEADLITPWRGFPTSGYTRSMGIYNWRANTKSYRFEIVRNADEGGLYTDPFVQLSILYIDADDEKSGYHMSDEVYYYAGIVQNFRKFPMLQWRLRAGYADVFDGVDSLDGRFEINCLF